MGLVKLLLGHAVLVQILQVLDPVLLFLKIGDHGIVDAMRALGPGIFQQSFSVEVHLRLTATLSRLSIGDQVDTLQIDSRVVKTDSRINITIALVRPWSLRLNSSMDLMRGSSSMWRSLLADGRGEPLDLDVAIGVDLVYHRLLVQLLLGGGIVVAASLPHLIGGSCS